MAKYDVLFVDDEEHLRRSVSQMLDLADYRVCAIPSATEALPLISRSFPGILVTDIRMPGMSGLDLLRRSRNIDADLPVILLTGHGDVPLAVEAMREGAYDFIEKPFSSKRFIEAVSRGIEKRRLSLEVRQLRDKVTARWDNLEARLIGRSEVMLNLREKIRAVASTAADCLIEGDNGSGKEVVARTIHDLSHEKDRPFVAINCAAMPVNMIEPELFGYEAGAFAGATRARFGKFEHARNGTIFLDGVDAMPLDVQAKLVPVLEERRIVRLGSHEPIDLNVRFIASTKADLEALAEAGRFRSDLLYLLNVVTMHVPSLAQRRTDIPALFVMLLRDAAARHGTVAPTPSQAYLAELTGHDWPGNVRELRNVAERLALGIEQAGPDDPAAQGTLAERVAAFERQTIATELESHRGRLKPVYESLGLSRKTLYDKMRRYDLSRDDYRETTGDEDE